MQPLADAWALQWPVPEGGVHPQTTALGTQCPSQFILVDWVAVTELSILSMDSIFSICE